MLIHYHLPAPTLFGYPFFPESLGRYYDFPQHGERRDNGIPYYNLHLVMSGSGYVRWHGSRVRLGAGDGFLYPPGAPQEYGTDAHQPWDVRWVHFHASAAMPFLQAADSSSGFLFSFGRPDKMALLSDTMMDLCEHYETRDEPKLSALVYELLAELSLNSKPSDGALPLEKQNDLRAVADHIRNRCSDPWTLNTMAALAGYSPFHFQRLFQAVIGRTPTRHLTQSRIVAAKRLLVTTRMTVKEIGQTVGFSQSSYFIQVFKRLEGLSPKEYREAYS